MATLKWKKNEAEALSEISGGTRLLLRFFYEPEDESCTRMINETLTNEKVVMTIERETAPVIYNVRESAEAAKKNRIDWTPAFVIADEGGNELERFVGYLPPEDFVPQMLLSKGLAAFHLGRFEEACREFGMLIEEYPASELVPEARYFLGAANYKQTGDHDSLIEVCHLLRDEHPESIWTKKCSVWSTYWSHTRKPFVGYNAGGSAGSGAY